MRSWLEAQGIAPLKRDRAGGALPYNKEKMVRLRLRPRTTQTPEPPAVKREQSPKLARKHRSYNQPLRQLLTAIPEEDGDAKANDRWIFTRADSMPNMPCRNRDVSPSRGLIPA